jgi:hypothetical protein
MYDINIERFYYKYPIFPLKNQQKEWKKRVNVFKPIYKKKNLEEILQIEGVWVRFRLRSVETISRQESKENKW